MQEIHEFDNIELRHHGELRDRSTGSWKNQETVKEVKRFNEFRTIDWVEDGLEEHKKRLSKHKNAQKNTFRENIASLALNWVVLASMGIIIGLIAGCLNIITAWLAGVRVGRCSSNFYLNKTFCCWGQSEESCSNWLPWTSFGLTNYFIYIIFSLAFSLSAAVLVKLYAPSAAGSGISEIKCVVSGFVMKGFLGWWTLLIKSIGLPLAIASGLSLGKEGPSVHYAACIGNSVAKLVPKYRKSASNGREFLTATSAAGVAVAFGSPMGGVLFAIEEISSLFQLSTILKSYFCALVAVSTLATINPFRTGQLVLFEVTYDKNWHYFEIPFYILIGAFGGVYGIAVSKLNLKVASFRKRYLSSFAVREVFFLTLLTAAFCYFNQFLRPDMTEVMQILFHECDKSFEHPVCSKNSNKITLVLSLCLATIARMFFTVITYGCKVPAGIFVPSMAAGATFGRAIGIIVEIIVEKNKDSSLFINCTNSGKCIIPGTYAFLGAAAALSGITHLTVTVVIIMFELTGAVRYIIPTMIVVIVTKTINDKWSQGGISEQMIVFNGLPFIDPKEDFKFKDTVDHAMCRSIVAFTATETELITLKQLRSTLNETDYRGFPIIESSLNPRIVGFVSRFELEYILKNYPNASEDTKCNFINDTNENNIYFGLVLNKSPLIVNSATGLDYILEIFVKLGPRYILIEKDGVLVGIITRKDLLRYEHTKHAINEQNDNSQLQLEEKIWDLMNNFSASLKEKMSEIFHRIT